MSLYSFDGVTFTEYQGVYTFDGVTWVRVDDPGDGGGDPGGGTGDYPKAAALADVLADLDLSAKHGYKSLWLEAVTKDRTFYSWDTPGTDIADLEMLTLVNFPRYSGDVVPDNTAYVIFRGSGTGTSETGYMLRINATSGVPYFAGYTNATVDYRGPEMTGVTVEGHGRYYVRIRAEGNTFKAKVWRDTETEPVSWQLEDTQTYHASGRVGLGAFAGDVQYEFLGVGVDGATAPDSSTVGTDQYYTQFDEYTVNTVPSDWTEMWDTPSTATVRYSRCTTPTSALYDALATGYSDKMDNKFLGVAYDPSLAKAMLAWNRPPGTSKFIPFADTLVPKGYVDIVTLWRFYGSTTSHWHGIVPYPVEDAAGGANYVSVRRYSASSASAGWTYQGDNTFPDFANFTYLPSMANDTWFRERMRIWLSGDNIVTIRLKWWLRGDVEPDAWAYEASFPHQEDAVSPSQVTVATDALIPFHPMDGSSILGVQCSCSATDYGEQLVQLAEFRAKYVDMEDVLADARTDSQTLLDPSV